MIPYVVWGLRFEMYIPILGANVDGRHVHVPFVSMERLHLGRRPRVRLVVDGLDAHAITIASCGIESAIHKYSVMPSKPLFYCGYAVEATGHNWPLLASFCLCFPNNFPNSLTRPKAPIEKSVCPFAWLTLAPMPTKPLC